MRLYRTAADPVLVSDGKAYVVAADWNDLLNDDNLADRLQSIASDSEPDDHALAASTKPAVPLVSQEVWAAGVTYYRSRTARMEESAEAGGGDFYDRVYEADRPELFLKATPHRTVGPGASMQLRSDSTWMVPEPELVLVITRTGTIIGYTIGNDLSSRDLEGENPLYLPQAKTFSRCAALGPGILVGKEPPSSDTRILLRVLRDGDLVVSGDTTLGSMKRTFSELVRYLFRDNEHPRGVFLMTGTGIIPPDEFTLQSGDVMEVEIDGIGCLSNPIQ